MCLLPVQHVISIFLSSHKKALNLFIGFLKPPCSQHKFKFFSFTYGAKRRLVAGSVLHNTCAIPYIPVKRNHAFTNKKQKKNALLYFTFCAEPLGTTTLQNGRNLFIAFFLVQIYLHRCLLLVDDDDGRREVLFVFKSERLI